MLVVPVDRAAISDAQLQRRGGLGGIGEPVQHGELGGSGLGGDQAQRAAGLHGGQLPVIAQQPDGRAAGGGDLDEPVEQERARHPGLVDQHHVAGAQRELAGLGRHWQPGAQPGGERPGGPLVPELVQVVGLDGELGAEHGGRRR